MKPLSLNKYLYANGDPVDLADPTGRDVFAFAFGFVGLLAGLGFGYSLRSRYDYWTLSTFRTILLFLLTGFAGFFLGYNFGAFIDFARLPRFKVGRSSGYTSEEYANTSFDDIKRELDQAIQAK